MRVDEPQVIRVGHHAALSELSHLGAGDQPGAVGGRQHRPAVLFTRDHPGQHLHGRGLATPRGVLQLPPQTAHLGVQAREFPASQRRGPEPERVLDASLAARLDLRGPLLDPDAEHQVTGRQGEGVQAVDTLSSPALPVAGGEQVRRFVHVVLGVERGPQHPQVAVVPREGRGQHGTDLVVFGIARVPRHQVGIGAAEDEPCLRAGLAHDQTVRHRDIPRGGALRSEPSPTNRATVCATFIMPSPPSFGPVRPCGDRLGGQPRPGQARTDAPVTAAAPKARQ